MIWIVATITTAVVCLAFIAGVLLVLLRRRPPTPPAPRAPSPTLPAAHTLVGVPRVDRATPVSRLPLAEEDRARLRRAARIPTAGPLPLPLRPAVPTVEAVIARQLGEVPDILGTYRRPDTLLPPRLVPAAAPDPLTDSTVGRLMAFTWEQPPEDGGTPDASGVREAC